MTTFAKQRANLNPNTCAHETLPLVKPTVFREHDARWLFDTEIKLMGVQALGLDIGIITPEMGVPPTSSHGTAITPLI